ncbi:hypothetical protein V8G54_025656, partial [Vigna mungo]
CPLSSTIVGVSNLFSSTFEKVQKDIVELPIFLFPLVLFAGAILPSEFRHRVMMHTPPLTNLFGMVVSVHFNLVLNLSFNHQMLEGEEGEIEALHCNHHQACHCNSINLTTTKLITFRLNSRSVTPKALPPCPPPYSLALMPGLSPPMQIKTES